MSGGAGFTERGRDGGRSCQGELSGSGGDEVVEHGCALEGGEGVVAFVEEVEGGAGDAAGEFFCEGPVEVVIEAAVPDADGDLDGGWVEGPWSGVELAVIEDGAAAGEHGSVEGREEFVEAGAIGEGFAVARRDGFEDELHDGPWELNLSEIDDDGDDGAEEPWGGVVDGEHEAVGGQEGAAVGEVVEGRGAAAVEDGADAVAEGCGAGEGVGAAAGDPED